ncbi:MAG: phosphate propanoyltransferase [Oscillospiraceae bacterium]|jgi:putative phosphotransacetylase|nr:phosphate propanoyltransferase [Oscillospiraceae bacterium]
MSHEISIETSARHVHVSREDLDTLFGPGYALTPKKDLSQPGQFACEERVQVVGPKGKFPAVSILGPVRPVTQVELSLADARSIGLTVPIRESGDIAGSPGCKLVGPKGEVVLAQGVIAAKRHIHATPADAERCGLTDKQVVAVRCESAGRAIIFGDVVVRVRPDFAWAMHIDTDESNAGAVASDAAGTIVKDA